MAGHPCANSDCTTPARAGMFACRECWHALPGDRRRAIWRAWRKVERGDLDGLDAYERARDAAIEWYEAHPEAAV